MNCGWLVIPEFWPRCVGWLSRVVGVGTDWGVQIATIARLVTDLYVFPEVGSAIAQVLRDRLADGTYARFEDEASFAAAVTADLQSVNGDRHLRLRFSDAEIPAGKAT